MPGQQMRWVALVTLCDSKLRYGSRKKNVRRKLNAMALEFSGRNVLLVDGNYLVALHLKVCLTVLADSIVRGTTSKEIVQMAKDVGAKKVIVASCAPPIR